MQKVEEKKQVYEILIIRNDQNHISALQSDNYDKCFERWEELTKIWTEAVEGEKPFVLKDPIVTAFNPGLIREITIRPVMTVSESKNENPYHKRMMKDGLSATLNNVTGGSDLLDGGYR